MLAKYPKLGYIWLETIGWPDVKFKSVSMQHATVIAEHPYSY